MLQAYEDKHISVAGVTAALTVQSDSGQAEQVWYSMCDVWLAD